jgi:hypothetical protein
MDSSFLVGSTQGIRGEAEIELRGGGCIDLSHLGPFRIALNRSTFVSHDWFAVPALDLIGPNINDITDHLVPFMQLMNTRPKSLT